MTAYAIALVKVKDPEKMQEYAALAGPTFPKYQGELVAKGQVTELLSGDMDLNIVAVMAFPSLEHIDIWYQSPEYQAAIPTRELASDMTILKVQAPSTNSQ